MADQIDLFYSGSGEGKTAAIIHLIAKIYNETGKQTVVNVGDGSALSYIESGLVDAKVVRLFDFAMRPYPLTICQQICEGMLPVDASDCNTLLVRPTDADLVKIGGWVFEGLSVMGSYIMGNTKGGLAERGAQGEKIGQDSPISIEDPGGLKFGGNPMSHFNVAQRQMLTNVQRTRALPGRVWWTAHERFSENVRVEGTDKFIGPEVAGSAMTPWISREFNNTLHFCTAGKMLRVQDDFSQKQVNFTAREYRVYTRDHNDPDGLVSVRYKAVNRCAIPSMMPDYFVGEGPGDNVLEFYKTMYAARKQWTVTKLITRTTETPTEAARVAPETPAAPVPSGPVVPLRSKFAVIGKG